MLTMLACQHMLTNYGTRTRNRRGCHQQRPGCRAPRGGSPASPVRAAGGAPGAGRARARLVVAGHRGAARRDQADRAPQVRPTDREAMMFERFDDDARTVVARAVEHAIRLGHRYVGGEHILLAVVFAGHPASDVMRAQGVTPELVEE